jgi:hypothetical protein
MALPASQYSVLDGRKIERISDDQFKWVCGVRAMWLFSTESARELIVGNHSHQGRDTQAGICGERGGDPCTDCNKHYLFRACARCYVGELKMFSWTAEPVLTVSVTVEPEAGGCTIQLLSCQVTTMVATISMLFVIGFSLMAAACPPRIVPGGAMQSFLAVAMIVHGVYP